MVYNLENNKQVTIVLRHDTIEFLTIIKNNMDSASEAQLHDFM